MPNFVSLPADVALQIWIDEPDDVETGNLAVKTEGRTHQIEAETIHALFGCAPHVTEARFSKLKVYDVPEGQDPVAFLAELLRQAVLDPSGHALCADHEITRCGVTRPNLTVTRIRLTRADFETVLFDSDNLPDRPAGIVTHPVTPHMKINLLEREGVSFHLSQLIKEAIALYADDDLAKSWSRHDFIAEYLMQRGVWMDLNFDATRTEPHTVWIEQDPD